MPRLRNDRTGVVVNVDDVTAATLRADGDPWVDAEPTSGKAPAKKTAAKKATSSNTEK